jgi:hypothetical protein
MTWRRVLILVAAVSATLVLAGCAAGPNTAATGGDSAGFLLGLWHGLICPITFVISLFTHSVGMYEVNNNGGWYNFGFLLGASAALGGGGAGAGRRRRSRAARDA